MNRKIITMLALVVILAAATWYAMQPKSVPPATSLEYKNAQYGFSFSLPDSWKGYSIVTDTWKGWAPGPQGQVLKEEGPLLSIRHPLWTQAVPRQDIPIMVFTIAQWNALQQDAFHIGAAPIGPSELGRNANYVFALPARYNYAFPAGYEEVDALLSKGSLHTLFPQINKFLQ